MIEKWNVESSPTGLTKGNLYTGIDQRCFWKWLLHFQNVYALPQTIRVTTVCNLKPLTKVSLKNLQQPKFSNTCSLSSGMQWPDNLISFWIAKRERGGGRENRRWLLDASVQCVAITNRCHGNAMTYAGRRSRGRLGVSGNLKILKIKKKFISFDSNLFGWDVILFKCVFTASLPEVLH